MPPPAPVRTSEPLLTAAEVTTLARRIEAGVLAREARLAARDVGATTEELHALEELGALAWRRFIEANLRLVAMVSAQTAARTRLPEADLFQEGCLGLMVAVQRFDHTRGYTFATYALFWIRSYVGSSSARQLGALNLPTSRAEQLRAARGVEADLAQRLGRAPSNAEVAAALGRSASWTAELLAHRAPASLESVVARAGIDAVDPGLAPPPGDDRRYAEVRARLDALPGPEREVLRLRLGFTGPAPCSLVETARRLSSTVARVRRLEERGLEGLRRNCPATLGQSA